MDLKDRLQRVQNVARILHQDLMQIEFKMNDLLKLYKKLKSRCKIFLQGYKLGAPWLEIMKKNSCKELNMIVWFRTGYINNMIYL